MINPDTWHPLVESLLEAVLIVDGFDFRIRLANAAACQLLGVAESGLIGRPVVELAVTPEDVFFWEDAAAGLSNEILSETALRRADGSIVNVDRRVSRVALDRETALYVVGIFDQSEQQRVEAELEKLVAELRATLESTADGILVVDLQSGIRSYNQRFAELWDLPQELLVRRDDAAIHGWLAQNAVEPGHYSDRLAALIRSPLLEASDVVVLRSGRILERVSMPQYARGRPIGRVFSFREITQRLAAESRLRLAAKVFSASLDAILVADGAFRIVAANPRSQKLTGYAEAELLGKLTKELFFKPDAPDFIERVWQHVDDDGYWENELWHRKKDGTSLPGLASFVRVLDEEDRSPQYIVFFKDLTEQLAAHKRIEELAYNDILTGLPNRILLGERIEFALNWSRREGKSFAIFFVDLDRFKQINDSLGHAFGDRVIIHVAERIKACLRQTDTAARLGGDEFLILLHDVDAQGAELTASRIGAAVADQYVLDGMTFTLSCSIGIALYPADGQTADDLIKNADTAMYRVKERGRSGFRFYQPQMNVDLLARVKLDQAMREALVRGGFRLHYQPRIDIVTNRVIGAEALLRWRDADLGEIPPVRFIPVAEESGFIAALGSWVLHEAVKQAASWRASGIDIVVAVNVSALQFQNKDFVSSVAAVLQSTNLPPAALELELTESILIQDAEEALQRLDELARLGVQLSIDDFGTGYSSLMYLKRFPINTLKIDRSFIDGLPDDESDTAIVSAIINLGRALHLDIVAEGVETEAHRHFLLKAGCNQFQGFLIAPGLAPDALLAHIRENRSQHQQEVATTAIPFG
jgi:diguanylate cyclase (GGDEF)-like protein/PAS domain S-box-containing protein